MTETQSSIRTTVINVLIVVTIILAAPTIVMGAIWWQTGSLPNFGDTRPLRIPSEDTLETIILNPGDNSATVTTNNYTGELALVIEGSVPARDTGLRDIFYIHADEFNLPLDEPVAAEPLLNINGIPLENQQYNAFHVYEIPYNAGPAAKPITFSLNAALTAPSETRQIRVFITQPDR